MAARLVEAARPLAEMSSAEVLPVARRRRLAEEHQAEWLFRSAEVRPRAALQLEAALVVLQVARRQAARQSTQARRG